MILEGMHETEIFDFSLPLRIAENQSENYNYPLHWHHAVEILYADSTGASMKINDRLYPLNKRDILVIRPGELHSFHTRNSTGKSSFVQFDPKLISNFGETPIKRNYLLNTVYIPMTDKPLHHQLEKHLQQLIYEYKSDSFTRELFVNARLLDITVLLLKAAAAATNNEPPTDLLRINPKVYDLSKLSGVFDYLEENYQKPIMLTDAANACGFSDSYLSREFKKAIGKNFHAFLNELRIRKAEQFLTDSSTTITEAAFAAGFNSLVTFNRVFKLVKGCTPSEYIKICY